ncbi:MAG: hypothetical protein HYR63_19860 [Proteobacteria bacterium]|nr:hypothetical protein [Pseudomonadota bacterium]
MSTISQFANAVAPHVTTVNPFGAARNRFAAIVASFRSSKVVVPSPDYSGHKGNDADFFATSKWNGYGRNGVTWDGIGWRI